MDRYKNQFFVTNESPQDQLFNSLIKKGFLKLTTFKNLKVYYHRTLKVCSAQDRDVKLVLLGYMINPLKPEANNCDLINDIAKTCKTKESLFRELQSYSGRYVILFENKDDLIALNDAISKKQLYYGFLGEALVLTSSPRMFLDFFNYDPQISSLKKEFINTKEFEKEEYAWFGDKSIDDRLKKILPNHFLDISKRRVLRVEIFPKDYGNENDILEYVSTILRNSLYAINRRYDLVQTLTAGWDTRVLLAASKAINNNINFYVFKRHELSNSHPDIIIPSRLAQKLNLRFEIIETSDLNQEFLSLYKKEHIYPGVLPKTKDIQYHYYNSSKKMHVININGNGAEIARCFYGHSNRKVNAHFLSSIAGYYKNKFVVSELETWLEEALRYSRKHNIPVLDLFYWEQRMGNWGALYPFAQDIAIEEYSPFNNKDLLLSILNIDYKERSYPDYLFFRKLIKKLWPDTLGEPVNPEKNITRFLRKVAYKRSPIIRYYSKKPLISYIIRKVINLIV